MNNKRQYVSMTSINKSEQDALDKKKAKFLRSGGKITRIKTQAPVPVPKRTEPANVVVRKRKDITERHSARRADVCAKYSDEVVQLFEEGKNMAESGRELNIPASWVKMCLQHNGLYVRRADKWPLDEGQKPLIGSNRQDRGRK